MKGSSLLEQGIQLFNASEYYQAHEVWEDLWRETTGADKAFYQGLIHAAVGLYHLQRGNAKGAQSQLAKSLKRLGAYSTEYAGIDNDGLMKQLIVVQASNSLSPIQISKLEAG